MKSANEYAVMPAEHFIDNIVEEWILKWDPVLESELLKTIKEQNRLIAIVKFEDSNFDINLQHVDDRQSAINGIKSHYAKLGFGMNFKTLSKEIALAGKPSILK